MSPVSPAKQVALALHTCVLYSDHYIRFSPRFTNNNRPFLVVVIKIRHFMAGLVFHGQSFHAAHIRYVIENSLLLDLATGLVENDMMKKDH